MNNSNPQHAVRYRKVRVDGKSLQQPINYGSNVRLHNYGELTEIPVLEGHVYDKRYLAKIYGVFERSLATYKRVLHIRVDLRFPQYSVDLPIRMDSGAITRFFSSFRAKLKADIAKRKKQGHRVHDTEPFYAWACEYGEVSSQQHYHVLILLNADTYRGMRYHSDSDRGLYRMIDQAWLSAIAFPGEADTASGLVHVPDRSTAVIHRDDTPAREKALGRASYLAKKKTKLRGHGRRSFGCSR